MSICEEIEYMDVSFNAEKNESTYYKKVFHVNRTPTPLKRPRHWCMSTELLRSQYKTHNKPKVYNPFNENLMQRLGETTISPTVFANAISPGQENEFGWNIDDVSKLNPVHIEDECMIDDDQVDDETESKLQETINNYFYSTHKVPSPWNNQAVDWEARKSTSSSETVSLKSKPKSDSNNCREVSTQTNLSFPLVLPDHVEEILKPYFMNSTCTSEGESSPTKDISNLRRKLFFMNDNDDPISPVQMRKNLSVSPLTRCSINSASSKGPVIGNHLGVQELPKDCHIPINVSPIINVSDKENTPPKNKNTDFIFTTPVSTLSVPKRRRINKSSMMMENSSDTGYQTMSIKELSSIASFGHSPKNILFTASTPT